MNKKIIIILVAQTLLLFFMIANKQWTLNTGAPVVLETQPVDPRSLFRGDYVRLNYLISDISLQDVEGDKHFRADDKVFVTLQQDGEFWKATAVHRKYPEIQSGQIVIRGTVNYVNNNRFRRHRQVKDEEVRDIHIRYGIENYFVPEGEGRDLERRVPDRKISIRVAVDSFGRAGIKAILFNGKAEYVETLF